MKLWAIFRRWLHCLRGGDHREFDWYDGQLRAVVGCTCGRCFWYHSPHHLVFWRYLQRWKGPQE